jgi:hypothetical protein
MAMWQIWLVSLFTFAVFPFGWLLLIGLREAEKHSNSEANIWFMIWLLQIVLLAGITTYYFGV